MLPTSSKRNWRGLAEKYSRPVTRLLWKDQGLGSGHGAALENTAPQFKAVSLAHKAAHNLDGSYHEPRHLRECVTALS